MNRKFRTEFALATRTTWGALAHQEDLGKVDIPKDKVPQIYFIARRPRMSCKRGSLKIVGNRFLGILEVHRAEGVYEIGFDINLGGEGRTYEVKTEYPFTRFTITWNNAEMHADISIFLSLQEDFPEKEIFDLEILYIGQSQQGSDSYGIKQRLENHKTLQKIYATALQQFPHFDIWIGLFHFELDMIVSMDGTVKETLTPTEEDNEHMSTVINSEISDEQAINFTEAGLIRYFEPEFNKTFKGKFPSAGHKSYDSCYSLDLNQLFIMLACDTIHADVFTKKIPSKEVHTMDFKLHSPEERKAMLDIT